MREKKVKYCKDCQADSFETYISRNNLCGECAMERVILAAKQMHEKKGVYYERYLTRMRTINEQRKRATG